MDPFADATDHAAAIRERRTTSRALVEMYLDRIERLNPALNAVITIDADGARRAADAADREVADRGPRGPLHGVPCTVKDAFATAGLRSTSGLPELADDVPSTDAVAVARLRAAGAIVIGKTNLPAGVTGQETANTLFGRTANPWDLARTPGGSSGGAAAALAAGLTGFELGSDSGGSIRQPAHCCGVFGHVPTHGVVPLRGHRPQVTDDLPGKDVDLMAVGPLARSGRDLALLLDVLAGPDPETDPAWRVELPPPTATRLAGARFAAWFDDDACPLEQDVRDALLAAADAAERAGARVDRAARPGFTLGDVRDVAFALWVASSADRTPDEQRAELADQARRADPAERSLAVQRARAEVMSHAEWLRLDDERRRLQQEWQRFLAGFDALLCPVIPVVAPEHDPCPDQVDSVDHRLERSIDVDGRPRPYLDQLTWNIAVGCAGLPSTVAPVGPPAGLPVGLQVVGRRFADRTTIALATALGELTGGFRPAPSFADR